MDQQRKNHVYLLDTRLLEEPERFALWYGRMPPGRREMIDRFRFAKDRRLSLGAGILLRHVLLSAGAEAGDLARGENGKPFLAGRDDLFFNLSHSGTMAACAVSDRPVGVDIQVRRQFGERLIRHVFLDEEIARVRAGCPDADAGFTALWSVKESLMKYLGTGVSLGAKRIRIYREDGLRAACRDYPCGGLRFTEYELPGYGLTVCAETAPFADAPEWFDPEE